MYNANGRRYLSEESNGRVGPWQCLVACPEEDEVHNGDLTFEDS